MFSASNCFLHLTAVMIFTKNGPFQTIRRPCNLKDYHTEPQDPPSPLPYRSPISNACPPTHRRLSESSRAPLRCFSDPQSANYEAFSPNPQQAVHGVRHSFHLELSVQQLPPSDDERTRALPCRRIHQPSTPVHTNFTVEDDDGIAEFASIDTAG